MYVFLPVCALHGVIWDPLPFVLPPAVDTLT